MATNTVRVTLQIRNDSSADWLSRNPVLAEGEFGLERTNQGQDFLLKMGDGVRDWAHLPYLNKLDASYFKQSSEDGSITFSDSFAQTINNIIVNAGGNAQIVISDDPTADTDPISYSYLRRYITDAIAAAGHLKRAIVDSLPVSDIDTNTIYLMANANGQGYDEYMYINGAWDVVGVTGDNSGYILPVASITTLGGVKADSPSIVGHENTEYLSVTQEGFMTLNKVSTSKLFVPTGDTLIIYGGTA